ncbi:MAG TPA: phage holin family protein [Nitrolancea sp.]|nr:phage holin family protein [Nitrolancea sp.]
MLAKILIYLIVNGVTLVILANVLPGQVAYNDDRTVVIFAAVLTILNLLVRPVLQLIALPLTCLTLGLFALVVNAFLFYVVARFVSGISMSYWGALAGAILAGVLNGALNRAVRDRR